MVLFDERFQTLHRSGVIIKMNGNDRIETDFVARGIALLVEARQVLPCFVGFAHAGMQDGSISIRFAQHIPKLVRLILVALDLRVVTVDQKVKVVEGLRVIPQMEMRFATSDASLEIGIIVIQDFLAARNAVRLRALGVCSLRARPGSMSHEILSRYSV